MDISRLHSYDGAKLPRKTHSHGIFYRVQVSWMSAQIDCRAFWSLYKIGITWYQFLILLDFYSICYQNFSNLISVRNCWFVKGCSYVAQLLWLWNYIQCCYFTKQLALAQESKILARCSTFRCADINLAEPEQMLWVSSISIALPGEKQWQDKDLWSTERFLL